MLAKSMPHAILRVAMSQDFPHDEKQRVREASIRNLVGSAHEVRFCLRDEKVVFGSVVSEANLAPWLVRPGEGTVAEGGSVLRGHVLGAVAAAGVLVVAQEHGDEHRREHRDVLDRHQAHEVVAEARGERGDDAERGDEHGGRHLPARAPGVAAVAHQGGGAEDGVDDGGRDLRGGVGHQRQQSAHRASMPNR